MAAVAFMCFAATSCNKDVNNANEDGKGTVTVSFALNDGKETRAAASTARPTTTWNNVERMMILFVEKDGVEVKDARIVNRPSDLTNATQITQTFTDVKANPTDGWDTYIVGNYPDSWNVGNVIGQSINNQLKMPAPKITVTDDPLTTVSDDDGAGLAPAGTTYGEAPEIFVAKKPASEVKIPIGGKLTISSPFTLTRAVSLIRIRVDQDPAEALANANIDFSKAVFAVRRATTTYSLPGTYTYKTADATTGATFPGTFEPATVSDTNVFWSNKNTLTAEPTTGYDFGTTPSPIKAAGIDLWSEYMVWAGGNRNNTEAAENAKRFDIVLSGITKNASYVPLGQTTPVAKGTRVYWTGAVDAIVGPNQILELDLTLKTAGSTGSTPEVGQYGTLEIFVNLIGWGDIINVDLPM